MSTPEELQAELAEQEAAAATAAARVLAIRQQIQETAQATLDSLGTPIETVETNLDDDLKKLFNDGHPALAVLIGILRQLQQINVNTKKTDAPAPTV